MENYAEITDAEELSEVKLSFSERWKSNRFLLVRWVYYLLISIWTIVMVVGGLIAWLISLLFI